MSSPNKAVEDRTMEARRKALVRGKDRIRSLPRMGKGKTLIIVV
jgi:hypothetical protein